MDSGCTSHMTPYLSDFDPDSFETENKVIEVADGHEVTCTTSGTIFLYFFNDDGEKIKLKVKGVLYVPDLSRRLFSLMSLFDQGHSISMQKGYGIRIIFNGESSPITLPLPNYHLFASCGVAKNNKSAKTGQPKKKRIPLDTLYKRMGLRSIKTLLSANQAELWNDSEINIIPDLISTSDHNIATIRKHN